MSHAIVEEVQPHEWTTEEAYRSGRMAYRIQVELSGNPFRGNLGDLWIRGWKEAASSDTTSAKRLDYAAMEEEDERASRNRKKFTKRRDPKQERR